MSSPSGSSPSAHGGTTARRTALVTGASSGIGAAFAEEFASHGFDLVLTARHEERLRGVAERLVQHHGVRVEVIACDLASRGGAATLCACIESHALTIDALVNSAGFGVPGGFMHPDWAVHEDMLQVMVAAPSELTYRLLPGMIERRYGRIVNVASLAGLVASGAGTLYGACKTFVVSLSTSLAHEVSVHGVHVTAVCPGLTRTEFHSTPGLSATVAGMPGWMWMDPSTVAQEGFAAVMAGRTVVVSGRMNRLLVAALRYVPRSLVAGVGRQMVRAYRRLRH